MYAESQFCTDFYKPDWEKEYHNCTGYKSKEILATHKGDEQGSWLRQFNSYSEYYRVTLEKFHDYYWFNPGSQLRTPAQISRKWVGRYSENWVSAVNKILNEI